MWLSLGTCNADVRLGLGSPALQNYYFSSCLIDVWLLPLPTFILILSLSYLFAANRKPYKSTYYHPYLPHIARRYYITSNILLMLYIIMTSMSLFKLTTSLSGNGFLFVDTFGVVAVVLLMMKRERGHFRGRELGIMLTVYWFFLFALYFLKARMLVTLDSINAPISYFGPPSYLNAYNEIDNYIIAFLCFFLGFIENLTMLKKLREGEVMGDLPLAGEGEEMGRGGNGNEMVEMGGNKV